MGVRFMPALVVMVYAAVLTIGIYAWVSIGGGLAGLAVVMVVGSFVVASVLTVAVLACLLVTLLRKLKA